MKKILIVQAKFYEHISEMLLEGAIAEIKKNNLSYDIIDVPGAFEIPAAIAFASKTNQYDGYVALGCVIRGETTHYDYVCVESARGLNELAYKNGLAIGYGIITCENEKQAIARADIKQKNKGGFAAMACAKMIKIKESFRSIV
ncbi:MAG: ribH [Rickettsiaceae bacterium]|jgi:6,7-dimethyl-8-ribityllumazine synthase|nr:ribH [Rickettsiaceae bacterium]